MNSPQAQAGTLKRVLGVGGLVVFGLAYMEPLAAFDTFGVVNEITHGHVPTAYVVTFVAMLFTGISYALIVRAYPSAGSAYTYARRAFGGRIGFLTGWALMLDYLLVPMINYLLLGIYLNAQFPALPIWAYSLFGLVVVTAVNVVGIKMVSNASLVLVGLQIVFAAVFACLAVMYVSAHPGTSLLQPFYEAGLSSGDVMAGAAVVSLSFLGFDAVSTMAEEARDPRRTVPLAIMLTMLIGGTLFIVISFMSTLIQPDPTAIQDADSAAIEVMELTAGQWLQSFFLVSYLSAVMASALAGQASVTRILYAMGRDGVLPRAVFGRISRRFQTPAGAVLFVGAISVVVVWGDLETMASIISFGALAAFSVVNLSVIKHFVVDLQVRGPKSLLLYGLSPLIGFLMTFYLWFSLSTLAFIVGLSWLGAGLLYLAVLTRGFQRPPPEVRFGADIAPIEPSDVEKAPLS